MQKQYLECGKIVALHALAGEVRVQPWGNDPAELTALRTLYLDAGKTALRVERARVHKNIVIIKFEGVNCAEEAQRIRDRVLYLDRNDQPPAEDEYFVQDLIGLEVVDADTGERYGELCAVSPTGANDVYHIRFPDGSEKLIPAIRQVVLCVDLEKNRMEIRPMEGLFDL